MSKSLASAPAVVLACLLVLSVAPARAAAPAGGTKAAAKAGAPATRAPAAKTVVSDPLKKKVSLDFKEVGLDKVVEFLTASCPGLSVAFDPILRTEGIDPASHFITIKVRDLSIGSAFRIILGPELALKPAAGRFIITTRLGLQRNMAGVSYPVVNLVMTGNPDAGGILNQAIPRAVNGQADPAVAAWSDEGGPATMEYVNGILAVTQTPRGHERIENLLDQLRLVLARKPNPAIPGPGAATAGPDARLRKKIDLALEKTPLREAIGQIDEALGGVNLVLDHSLRDDQLQRPVNAKAQQVTGEAALDLVLKPDLTCVVESDYILVTSWEKATCQLETIVYPAGRWAAAGEPDRAALDAQIDTLMKAVNSVKDRAVAAWADDGGPASIQLYGGALIITQTRRGHRRIAALMSTRPTRPAAR